MVVGDVAGRFSGSGRLGRAAWRSHAPALRSISIDGMVAAARRYRRFPIFSTPSAIVNTVGLQAPLLLLVVLYGSGAGGQFALADRLCGLPVTLLATAVGRVFFAEAARMHREEPGALRALFVAATRSLVRVAIVPFVLLAVFAPLLAGLVFGAEWTEAGLFVTILAPMYFIILITNPTGSTLDVLERQDLQLGLGLLRLALFCGAVFAATALRLPPIGAVAVLSAAGCLTYGAYGLASWRAIGAGDAVRTRAANTGGRQ
jgi:O-antigen/teichoic acid export membrane protein